MCESRGCVHGGTQTPPLSHVRRGPRAPSQGVAARAETPRRAGAREFGRDTTYTSRTGAGARCVDARTADPAERADVMTIERGHTRNTSMAHNVMALETSTQRASSRFPHYAVPPVPVRPSRRACARAPRPLHAQLHQYTRPACLVLLAWGTLTRPWGSSPSSPRRVWARRAQPA